jgi:hypothetical protein
VAMRASLLKLANDLHHCDEVSKTSFEIITKYRIDIARVKEERRAAIEKTMRSKTWQARNSSAKGLPATGPIPLDTTLPSLPPTDDSLLQSAILKAIVDKRSFYVEVQNILTLNDPPPHIGKLEQLVIQATTAKGTANSRLAGPSQNAETFPQNYHFRRNHAGWLIDWRDAN